MDITYNTLHLIKDGKPWMPNMGEMQYSRTDPRHWKENLYKMKAGGIDIVSAYVFWNHHEEIEGIYRFDGSRNLRKFLRLVKECGLYLMLRIGPFVHGEARNGGIPDWLVDKDFPIRENDERYFACVREYFGKLYEQADGYMIGQGGPIIAIQIENEYGPCGGLKGAEGYRHMVRLEKILKEVGFVTPLYTATGWGNACIGDCLPTFGGYCDAPWEAGIQPTALSVNYVFREDDNDAQILSNYSDDDVPMDVSGQFPFLGVEMGGGIHATHNRRPIAIAQDIGAITTVKMGQGCNLIGYYVYTGGKNPKGVLTGLQEYVNWDRCAGCGNDLPEFDYDFQSPISSCGLVKPSYHEARRLLMFVRDFGETLSTMPSYLTDDNPRDPHNTDALRYAVRRKDGSGFLFLNNYQRHLPLPERRVERLPIADSDAVFENITLRDGEYAIYPFNMPIGNAVLKTAKATPLCILDGKTYVFYTDGDPDYRLEGDLGDCRILTLTQRQARSAYKVHLDKDYLFLSDSVVMATDRGIELLGTDTPAFAVLPDLPNGFEKIGTDGEFTCYRGVIDKIEVPVTCDKTDAGWKLRMHYPENLGRQNVVLTIDYIGDMGKLYEDGEMRIDQYCNGVPWRTSLSDLDLPEELDLTISPLLEDDPVYIEVPVEYTDGKAAYIKDISVEVQYTTVLPLR